MRCRKARWFLSARCDGTLSERQRVRLEDHLKGCAECRREAFYFSEIAVYAGRLEKAPVRPDFNVRLRAAIHRTEAAASKPKHWYQLPRYAFLRPAMALAVLVITIGGGITGYVLTQSVDTNATYSSQPIPAQNTGLLADDQAPIEHGMTPVGSLSAEDIRVRQYLESSQGPRDYFVETVSVEDPIAEKRQTQYFNPTVTADQMTQNPAY